MDAVLQHCLTDNTTQYYNTLTKNKSIQKPTFGRIEEIEEWIILNCFRHCSLRAATFMLLRFLHHLHCYVFAFVPVDFTTTNNNDYKTS